MEKLDKVIAALTGCIVCNCSNCEYFCPDRDAGCTERLMEDTLEVIKDLRSRLDDAKNGRLELARKYQVLEAERDDLRKNNETLHHINEDWRTAVARLHKRIDEARAAGMRLNGVAEKPGTNYRKITKMGPLWLANWIYRTGTVCECCDLHGCCGIPEEEVTEEYCLEHILMWLGQEVEK